MLEGIHKKDIRKVKNNYPYHISNYPYSLKLKFFKSFVNSKDSVQLIYGSKDPLG
jgi:hypothetical protein